MTNSKLFVKIKKVIVLLAVMMMSVVGYAQSVIGKWVTEGGDSMDHYISPR